MTNRSSTPTACADCGVPLVAKSRPVPEGARHHKARGLCSTCYTRAQSAGVMPLPTRNGGRSSTEMKPCTRCGVSTRVILCRDCRSVEAPETWAAWGWEAA